MAIVRAYIDGFNLYHAIADTGIKEIKWLNLWELSKSFLTPEDTLDEVHFFTAVLNWNEAKQKRHVNYIRALRAVGVCVHEGTFKRSPRKCWEMDRTCNHKEEKQTDVAIAVRMVRDALDGHIEKAILVTADSDQIPTVKLIEQQLGIPVLLRYPPNRKSHARDLGNQVRDRGEISVGRMRSCILPRTVSDGTGKRVASMPALYGAS